MTESAQELKQRLKEHAMETITAKGMPPVSIPKQDWPIWAKALRHIAKPEDKGIGDVLYRTIGHERSIAFKLWFKSTFGKDCGCDGRQGRYNLLYPLP